MHAFLLILTVSSADLGKIDFPVTASPAARQHFVRGVLALHSFFYDEAESEFREATKAQPDFAMGYWGEAMTHDHPVWQFQDLEGGRAVLAKVRGLEKATPRERAWIEAARVLFGEGDRVARHVAFADAMAKLARDFPDDEARAFHALALLGKGGQADVHARMQAGAVALDVFAHNPRHPGAVHYIIHSFDDPDHAILALPAARRYAEIAPAAHHARHMPSHIFVQLGMWVEAAASNESSWAASEAWVARSKRGLEQRDYHSLSWLTQIALEQGRLSRARQTLEVFADAVKKTNNRYVRGNYAELAVAVLREARDYAMAEGLLAPLSPAGGAQTAGEHAGCSAPKSNPYMEIVEREATAVLRALVAASHRDDKAVASELKKMKAARVDMAKLPDQPAESLKVMEMNEQMILAEAAQGRGKTAEAIAAARRVVAIDDALPPPSGPSYGFDSHERLGELLLAAKQSKEAAAEFQKALARHPRRARSLLGAARAANALGDRAAAQARSRELLRGLETSGCGLAGT